MDSPPNITSESVTAPPRVSVELTNVCNLRCSYCMRDEDALYHTPANFFPADLMRRVARGARDSYGVRYVSFTGGEVTIHPRFKEIVEAVVEEGLEFSFVTNGWHFDRVYKLLLRHRESLRAVAFSLDGATREAHDRWRGDGSFVRVMRAIARCYASRLPFIIKFGVRRDSVPHLQDIALLAARLGARELHFSHFLPTSPEADAESALTREERTDAEHEIAILSKVFRMGIGLAAGYYNTNPDPPCVVLRGANCNIDYRGRMTLCCNLSGYRNAADEPDVVADLNEEEFADAYPRLQRVAAEQNDRRRRILEAAAAAGREVDLYTGSPCLLCLQSFGKIPWRGPVPEGVRARTLPVLGQVSAATSCAAPSV